MQGKPNPILASSTDINYENNAFIFAEKNDKKLVCVTRITDLARPSERLSRTGS